MNPRMVRMSTGWFGGPKSQTTLDSAPRMPLIYGLPQSLAAPPQSQPTPDVLIPA